MLSRAKWLLEGVAGLAGLVLVVFIFADYGQAETDSRWLAPTNFSLRPQPGLSGAPPSWNGNIDCYQETESVCAAETPYGWASSSSAIRLANSSGYRPVVSNVDGRQHFIAIPNSDSFITYTTDPVYGLYLNFNYNLTASIKLANDRYQVMRPPDGRLQDVSGRRLAADYDSMGFSSNGEWMIVSAPNLAMLRVNLHDFRVLPFAAGFNYTIGLGPDPQTAITNDGRYAAVASRDFNRFTVYDLATCGAAPSVITGPVNCQSRDLYSLMSQQVPGFSGAGDLRFLSDDTLSFYAGGTKYLLSSDNTVHQQDLLALGDSYISGEGAYQYLPGTDTSDNQCHVSSVSYPYLLGYDLNYDSYHSVACSGATTNDIVNSTDKYAGQSKPHTEKADFTDAQLGAILGGFEPGYIGQLDFVKQYQPQTMTVSIGGNDIGFSDRLRSCLGAGTCYSSYEDRLEFVREVNQTFPRLVSTYTKLKNSGAADARIYVIGYPQIADADGSCAVNVLMNHEELVFTQQAIDYLDSVIQAAADRAGVFYVDTQDAFFGHRLCEAESPSVAMNGISAGNDFPDFLGGPIGRESYHPNALGHQLLENKIQSATSNLGQSMPSPNLGAEPPNENGLDILNAPRSGRPVSAAEFDPDLAAGSAHQNETLNISVDGTKHALAPGSTLRAELHSSAVSLGSFTADAGGNLSASAAIPHDAPAGYHVLHLYGTDITGQPIDIYKTVYIFGDNGDSNDSSGAQPTVNITADLSSSSSELAVAGPAIPAGQGHQANLSGTAVLGASTMPRPAVKSLPADDSLRVPARYYVIAGFGFLMAAGLSYGLKNKW